MFGSVWSLGRLVQIVERYFEYSNSRNIPFVSFSSPFLFLHGYTRLFFFSC